MTDTRVWMYSTAGEAQIFDSPEDVPADGSWFANPEEAAAPASPKKAKADPVAEGA